MACTRISSNVLLIASVKASMIFTWLTIAVGIGAFRLFRMLSTIPACTEPYRSCGRVRAVWNNVVGEITG